jgi:hypothetical protein
MDISFRERVFLCYLEAPSGQRAHLPFRTFNRVGHESVRLNFLVTLISRSWLFANGFRLVEVT